jgi:hypothetical protein
MTQLLTRLILLLLLILLPLLLGAAVTGGLYTRSKAEPSDIPLEKRWCARGL